jgi:cytochrome c peroxidase
MFEGLETTLMVGALVILVGAMALFLIVSYDLVPGRDGVREHIGVERWIVGCALGMGVFAFALKMAVTLTVSSYPEHTIKPLLPDAQPVDWVADPSPATARPHRWEALPLRAPYPPNDPPTLAKTTLGERLFHDPRLSRDGSLSCASCHATRAKAGADGDAVATGIEGQKGDRNTPTVWNAAFQARLFWDGRATSLEDQALGPLLNPIEMGMPNIGTTREVVARVMMDFTARALVETGRGWSRVLDPTALSREMGPGNGETAALLAGRPD